MKRSIVLLALLLCAAAVLTVFCAERLNAEGAEVEVSRTVISGDSAAADGLRMVSRFNWDGHLLWETEFDASASAQTSFRFEQSGGGARKLESGDEVILEMEDLFYSMSTMGGDLKIEDDYPYSRLVRDVADRAAAGETHGEVVRLADYYEYYPLRFFLYYKDGAYFDEASADAVRDYIRIPVREEHRMRVTVQKDEKGRIISIELEDFSGGVRLQSSSYIAENGIYLAICSVGVDDEAPAPLPPEMAGVHYIPLVRDAGGRVSVDAEGMRLIYGCEFTALDDARFCAGLREGDVLLFARAERVPVEREPWSSLYTVHTEGVPLLLFFRDGEEPELCQRLVLHEENTALDALTHGEDFIGAVYFDGSVALLTRGSLDYVRELRGELYDYAPVPTKHWGDRSCVMAYDGRRLAVLAYKKWFGDISVYLNVFDRTGRLYTGRYDFGREEALVESDHYAPLAVSWE